MPDQALHRSAPSVAPGELIRWATRMEAECDLVRLAGRFIARDLIVAAVGTYELVEAYPDAKYLPSYLVLAHHDSDYFHVLFAADVDGNNVRVVTAYRPDLNEWEENLANRRLSS